MFGSGYLIATGLVLTASHVLQSPDSLKQPSPGDGCEVLAWPCESAEGWLPASVTWADSDHDIALVSVASNFATSPVRFGRFESAAVVPWEAIGFPIASLDAEGRQPETAFGRTPFSQAPSGRLALTVESREPRAREGGGSGWAGLSGAAVFSGERLVGVVTTDPGDWKRSLEAMRITTVTDVDGFREALGGTLVIEQADSLGELSEVLDRLPSRPDPRYRATLRVIRQRTPVLLGRDAELARIAAFAAGSGDAFGPSAGSSGYVWLTGKAWAGKTALLAEAVYDAPDQVDVVAYFLLARDTDASREGFLNAVVPQLTWLLDLDDPPTHDLALFRDLWARAAARAETLGRHLLLWWAGWMRTCVQQAPAWPPLCRRSNSVGTPACWWQAAPCPAFPQMSTPAIRYGPSRRFSSPKAPAPSS
jgi:Trypsin-like peptidase domain